MDDAHGSKLIVLLLNCTADYIRRRGHAQAYAKRFSNNHNSSIIFKC